MICVRSRGNLKHLYLVHLGVKKFYIEQEPYTHMLQFAGWLNATKM